METIEISKNKNVEIDKIHEKITIQFKHVYFFIELEDEWCPTLKISKIVNDIDGSNRLTIQPYEKSITVS